MNDERAERSGNAGQLRRAVHLRVIDVKANRDASCGQGLAQTIERGVESLAGIELGVRDEAARVIERGVEKHLSPAAACALNPGTEEHVGLPDLITEFGFELLMSLRREQLLFRQTALFEKAVERRG